MYADDAAIFVKPDRNDLSNLALLLTSFGEVTGLRTNLLKTSVTPISCNETNLEAILSSFPIVRSSFPIKYLGLPLTVRRLRKIDFQPLVEKSNFQDFGMARATPHTGWTGLPDKISALLTAGLPANCPQSTY